LDGHLRIAPASHSLGEVTVPTHLDRIIEYLFHQREADDDALARALDIDRHHINGLCTQLQQHGLIERDRHSLTGKPMNRLVTGAIPNARDGEARRRPTDVESLTLPSTLTSRPIETNAVVGVRTLPPELAGDAPVSGYTGALGLSDDRVKIAVATALEGAGWTTEVRWGKTPGIDIDARCGRARLVIVVKGEDSLRSMRVNHFVGALGELLQRMDSPNAHYALALPSHRQFVSLATRLPAWVRSHLQLSFLLVEATAEDAYDVTMLSPPGSRISFW
jgi:hypothetical protein